MSNVPQFAEGELVTVQIKNARVVGTGLASLPNVILETENQFGPWTFEVPTSYPGVDVTRVAPAEWPPQPGDIWADHSNYKWAGLIWDGGVKLYPVEQAAATREWPESVMDQCGPMRLLYRDGWTPATDTAPAEPEPGQDDERAELVAGYRALADFIAAHPGLPDLPRRVSWYSRSQEAHTAWVEALPDASTSDHPHQNTIQHWASAKLRGLGLDLTWIEDLPPAVEPLPHRQPADTRPSLGEALADAFPEAVSACLNAFSSEALCPNDAVPGKHFCQECIDSGRAAATVANDVTLRGAL